MTANPSVLSAQSLGKESMPSGSCFRPFTW